MSRTRMDLATIALKAPSVDEQSRPGPRTVGGGDDVNQPTLAKRFVQSLPPSLVPYAELMRISRPVGTWLLYNPGLWSVTMAACATAAPLSKTLYTLGVLGVGSFVMRGAGCTINDILDRDIDAKVERTKVRPLASGQISLPNATIFLIAQLSAGLACLLALPSNALLWGAASVPFILVYPLFKRFTNYPQVSLSFCFTWLASLGFASMDVWNFPAMLSLHASCFLWCMVYDTIYAHQDKHYDKQAGVKSTALKWGSDTKPIISVLTVGQLALLTASGVFSGMCPIFYGSVALFAQRLYSMIKDVDLDDPASCWDAFTSNIGHGHVVFAGAALDYLMRLWSVRGL